MKGKRTKKEREKSSRNIIRTIMFLVFAFLMCFSGIKIFYWFKENNENRELIDELSKVVNFDNVSESKYEINFTALKQINPDIIGWLKVNGTEINYPVVKTSDNDFYMNHNFEKKYNSAGWVFMDYTNKADCTDKNTIIYAHNRRNGSMFSTLKNVLNESWYNNKENLLIDFITEKENFKYKVFSVYQLEKEEYYLTTKFSNDEQYETFLSKLKSRSIKDFGEETSSEDKILTLSTCADNNEYRIVVHAKKVN